MRHPKKPAPTGYATSRDGGRRRARGPVARCAAATVEAMERRLLFSLSTIGTEFGVNQTTGDQQGTPVIAADANGDFVAAWTAGGSQDGSGNGVYARRYAASGAALSDEFRVNAYTNGDQSDPSIAMDADGDFVVAWTSYGQDGSFNGIYAQRYAASGAPRGGEFRVNSTTTGYQSFPSVATDAYGDFVVAWASAGQDGSFDGVYAQRFNAAGSPQASEFLVNTHTSSAQTLPSVAMDASGDFAIAWQSYLNEGPAGAFSYGIYAKRYDAQGVERTVPAGVPKGEGNEFRVNTTTAAAQRFVSVAMDYAGDLIATWESYAPDGAGETGDGGAFAQRFTPAGGLAGGEFRVNSFTSGHQVNPSVSADAAGDFVIAWTSYGDQDGDAGGVYAKRYTSAGAELPPAAGATAGVGNEFRVNTTTTGEQTFPTVATDADGDAVIAWQSYAQDAPGGYGVYAQRYDESTAHAGPILSGVVASGNDVFPGKRLIHAITGVTLDFSQNLDTTGGAAGANSALNLANYRLTRDGADASSMITGVTFGFDNATRKYEAALTLSAPLPDGAYVISARQTLRNPAGNALDGNLDGLPGGGVDASVPFTVQSVVRTGPEFHVNTFVPGLQDSPAVSLDAAGNYVVVWESEAESTNSHDVYARLYNAAGQPLTGETLVTTGAFNRYNPAVAMDAAGNFVVAWESDGQDGSRFGIYARVFAAGGTPLGGEFRVNVTTSGFQEDPAVAIAPTGGEFVVAWDGPSGPGTGNDVFVRRFTTAGGGTPLGTEVRANTFLADSQFAPAVAMDAAGNFVVAWDGVGEDAEFGSADQGIYAMRYSSNGVELPPPTGLPNDGNEFRVNTFTAGDQVLPDVAMDADGNFVVTWQSVGQIPGDGTAVLAKRYASSGAELPPPAGVILGSGNEFVVSAFAGGLEIGPSIAMDADGDFAIAWTDGTGLDGSGYGVFARRYSSGAAPQGAAFQVNRFTTADQIVPDVAADPDGDFVITWESYEQEGPAADRFGVYAQRYGANQPPTSLGISAVNVQQGTANTVVNLWDAFDDPNTDDDMLAFAVTGDTNPALFSGTPVSSAAGTLTLDYAPSQTGQATLTVRATDPSGLFVETSFVVTVTPSQGPVLTAITVNDGSAQRSQVKSLKLTFDRAVTLAAGASSLVRLNSGGSGANDNSAPTDASAALAAPTSGDGGVTWVYAFAAGNPFMQTVSGNPTGSLVDGIYTLSVDPTKVAANGAAMTAPASLTFHRLFGDVNGNKTVNNQDYGLFRNAFLKSTGQAGFDPAFDFDNSTTVNNLDYGQFRTRFLKVFTY